MLGHAALILGAALAAVAVVCVLSPLAVSFDAPAGSDLCTLALSHPACRLSARVPQELVVAWVTGERPWPPLTGEVAGIPVPPLASWFRRRSAGKRKGEPQSGPTARAPLLERAKGVGAALKAEESHLRAAARIDALSLELGYGTGDPASTAVLTGVLFDLASLLPAPCEVSLLASWTEARLALVGHVRLLVFPWQATVAGLRLRSALRRLGSAPQES